MASRPHFRSIVRLFCLEGAFAVAYDAWIGATYLSGLAGELGISVQALSLLAAAPWIGSMGQVLGVVIMERAPSVRKYTLWAASGARTLWAVPLLAAGYWWLRSRFYAVPFPVQSWFALATFVAILAALLATSAGVSWQSWLRGWIPGQIRGRFFATRQRYTVAALIFAHLVATLWVSWKPGGVYAGYAILGTMALLAAATSTWLLSRIPDAPPERSPHPASATIERRPLAETLLEPFRDRKFRNVLIFGTAFNGAFQLAGPFFAYYFTKEMQFSMSQVAFWLLLYNCGSLVAAGYWGRKIDLVGKPASIVWVTAHLMALSPLPYLINSKNLLSIVAPLEHLSNGFIASGYQLAWATLLFRTVPQGRNVAYFSAYTACVGIASAGASMIGGQLATLLAPYGGLRTLWIVGATARLIAIWACFRFIAEYGKAPALVTPLVRGTVLVPARAYSKAKAMLATLPLHIQGR